MTKDELEEKVEKLFIAFKELTNKFDFPEETSFVIWIGHGKGHFSHFGNGCLRCVAEDLKQFPHLDSEVIN